MKNVAWLARITFMPRGKSNSEGVDDTRLAGYEYFFFFFL